MEIKNIYPDELEDFLSQKKDSQFLLVDVRQAEEYEQEHIPGAKLLPLSELEYRLDELNEDRELVFYCRSGRRSNVSASFAKDSGLVGTNIYNLVGGISAWEGKVLEEFPKLDVVENFEDLSQVLTQAINMEKGTQVLYETMMEKSPDPQLKNTMQKLFKMEIAHAKVIYKYLSKIDKVEPFAELYARLKGDIVEGGWDLEAMIDKIQEEEGNLCLFLFELALDLEYRAYDLYRNMAERSEEVDWQKAFFYLSEQEKAHARLLAQRLPDCFF